MTSGESGIPAGRAVGSAGEKGAGRDWRQDWAGHGRAHNAAAPRRAAPPAPLQEEASSACDYGGGKLPLQGQSRRALRTLGRSGGAGKVAGAPQNVGLRARTQGARSLPAARPDAWGAACAALLVPARVRRRRCRAALVAAAAAAAACCAASLCGCAKPAAGPGQHGLR
jgi:hypothetical protein